MVGVLILDAVPGAQGMEVHIGEGFNLICPVPWGGPSLANRVLSPRQDYTVNNQRHSQPGGARSASAHFLKDEQGINLGIRLRVAFVALLLLAGAANAQKLDLNGNGTSDVWEALNNAATFAPDFDSDNDSVPNRLEAAAGSDPRDAQSLPRISGYRFITNGLAVSFLVQMEAPRGKRVELQSTSEPGNGAATNWTSEGALVVRSGASVAISAPADRPACRCAICHATTAWPKPCSAPTARPGWAPQRRPRRPCRPCSQRRALACRHRAT